MTINVHPYENESERVRVYERRMPRRSKVEMVAEGFRMVEGRNPYWSKFTTNTGSCTFEVRVQGSREVTVYTHYKG